MNRFALFVVGEPGAGKTTLVRSILGTSLELHQKPKWTISGEKKIIAAGHYSGDTFDGGDRVAYNGVDDALTYWEQSLTAYPLTIFDGDRFSHEGALSRVAQTAIPLCAFVAVNRGEALMRRTRRGSKQNHSWVTGRLTKAGNFMALFPMDNIIVLNGDRAPERVVEQLRGSLKSKGIEV